MGGIGGKWLGGLKSVAPVTLSFFMAAVMVSAERGLKRGVFRTGDVPEPEPGHLLLKVVHFLWQPDDSSYQHVWPVSCPVGFFYHLQFWVLFSVFPASTPKWAWGCAGHGVQLADRAGDDHRILRGCVRERGRRRRRWNLRPHAHAHHWVRSQVFNSYFQM